ncbi:toxin-antitoxin system TumE family protein [Paenibacillus sp. DYY-L-2]|uniref:toxin-antitoxin system TumE family protein n=1 Tax=Paenibacillus sp. DYY-L-2 TaxID=3447013 RepID=UPI003F4FC863
MALEIPKSNFRFIEQNFSDIILEIRDGVNGIRSGAKSIRKTIVFRDTSKLHCIEELDSNGSYIELYWYDWYDNNKNLIMKFHAHYHPDGTPAEITVFDPYHIHLSNESRIHNTSHRELDSILEFIRLRHYSIKNS